MVDSPRFRRILLGLFAVSGFAGLIYESVWSHYLKLMLGHAAYAQTLVLAIFMGGMAAGAWWAGRRSEGWRNPLSVYAGVEAVIGLFALSFHPVFVRTLDALYASVLPSIDGAATAALVKWTVAALLILPQSVLLGTTFPLMSAAVLRVCPARPGATLALLYFTNSIGACAGVLVSGFVFVPWSGLPGTVRIAGALNLALAAGVWVLARRAPSAAPAATPDLEASSRGLLPALSAAALLTGAASFCYEIGWIRMLSLVLGTTTQAFELMLSAFILGLALGGLWIRRRIDRTGSPLRVAGHVQLLMGVFALVTVPLYATTFDVMAFLLRHLEKTERGYVLFQAGSDAIALAVMLPATLMAGMTLPLFTFTLLARGGGERSIGRIYAANTVGAIAGVLAAVHVVMPALGTKGLIVTGASVDLALGVALLGAARARLYRGEWVAATVAASLVLGWVVFDVHPDPRRSASGVYRYGTSELPPGSEVVYHRDGKTATISMIRQQDGSLKISTNGKPDARIAVAGGPATSDEVTMVMLGALPLALHPGARTVANIGMGSGMTTHTLLGSRTLERVDTVEIEAAVYEAARGFGPLVARAFTDPRSRLHVEDAKTFFSNTGGRYDLIISEPSNPWVSGVASLFSTEFYRHVRAHLAPGGLLVQWVHLYEADLDLLASIFKALATSFDDYTVFHTDNANVIVVATDDGNLGRLDPSVLRQPLLRADLARVGLSRVEDLELRRVGSRRLLQPVFDSIPAPANSDYRPYVATNAPRSRYLGHDAADLTRLHVAPIPLAELLDPRVRRDMEPHTAGEFTPGHARRAAFEIVHALASPTVPARDEDPPDALRRQLAAACAGTDGDETSSIDTLLRLAASTNPYLRGEPLERMWANVAAIVCEGRPSPRIDAWLALHRATAARDTKAMTAGALRLLRDRETTAPREIEFLVATGLAASLADGDRVGAGLFEKRARELYPSGVEPPFYLELLLARIPARRPGA